MQVTRNYIQQKLVSDPRWVRRAIVVLHQKGLYRSKEDKITLQWLYEHPSYPEYARGVALDYVDELYNLTQVRKDKVKDKEGVDVTRVPEDEEI